MHWFDLAESTTVLECVIASLRCGVGYVMLRYVTLAHQSNSMVDSVLE